MSKQSKQKADDGPLLPPIARAKHDEDLIDMTAMVDIVFFLLIFFLVTSLKAIESVMDMPTPESAAGTTPKTMSDYQNDPQTVMVNIQDDDTILIDDEQVFGDDEMRLKLRNIRQETPSINAAMIVGSADASHGAAVRVFDACAAVGLDKPIFTVEEDE